MAGDPMENFYLYAQQKKAQGGNVGWGEIDEAFRAGGQLGAGPGFEDMLGGVGESMAGKPNLGHTQPPRSTHRDVRRRTHEQGYKHDRSKVDPELRAMADKARAKAAERNQRILRALLIGDAFSTPSVRYENNENVSGNIPAAKLWGGAIEVPGVGFIQGINENVLEDGDLEYAIQEFQRYKDTQKR